jgi:hypothetical protein
MLVQKLVSHLGEEHIYLRHLRTKSLGEYFNLRETGGWRKLRNEELHN